MRMQYLSALTALSSGVTADYLNVVTNCGVFGNCGSEKAVWYTDFGYNPVDANEGCRDPNIPNMNTLCMDWGNRRGHFFFDGQGKRCIQERAVAEYGDFSFSTWAEVVCSW
ncbi:hypothetical protein TrVFT333_002589 [Trichoderma virens FT-333]|nr:hypothetical protein TrVFT333_002589 [Trichoderma virens FT-333]